MIGQSIDLEGEMGLDRTFALATKGARGQLAVGNHLDLELVVRGLTRQPQPQRQGPGTRRDRHIWSMQQTARPAGYVDGAGGPLRPGLADKEELPFPDQRRQIAACQITEEGRNGALGEPPLIVSQPVPPSEISALIRRETGRCQILDGLADYGLVEGHPQMT